MDRAEEVGRRFLKGQNYNIIAKEMGIQRREVIEAHENFKAMLRRESESASEVRERLLDIIYESDEAYRMLIDEGWKTSQEADNQGQLSNKINALKLVQSTVKIRTDMLQEAGISQDNEIIEELNAAKEKQDILVGILRDIKDEYPEIAAKIAKRLSRVSGSVEVISTVPAPGEDN